MQGQILRPQLAMNSSLPLWPHRFPHFGYILLGGGGALILDPCRAFDLFASVDAHLWFREGELAGVGGGEGGTKKGGKTADKKFLQKREE